MKLINFVKYRDLAKIASARSAHFAYADGLRAQGKLAIGGPLMDDQGRRIGLLFVYEAASADEALAFAKEDPFTLANALSSYEISEWRLRGVNLDLLIAANRAADQKGGEPDQGQELREAADGALQLRRGVAAAADLPAGFRQRASRIIDQLLGGALVGRIVRQP